MKWINYNVNKNLYLVIGPYMKKKWFTLLELLIVMAILGILFVMLLKTYNRISTMVFRVQQEKEVTQEILQVSQIVQNLADRNAIDYSKYTIESSWVTLVINKWITDVLYLSWLDGEVVLYTTGDCIDPGVEYVFTGAWSWCSLYADVWGKTRELINTKKVLFSKVIFKIIPFASEQQYIDTENLCEGSYLTCLNSPGFWMIFTAYSVNYWTQWATHVRVPFQQFF